MAQKEEEKVKKNKKKTEPKIIHDERTGETFELIPLEEYFDEEVEKGADISRGLAVAKQAVGHLHTSPEAAAKLSSEIDRLAKKYTGGKDSADAATSKSTQKKTEKKGKSASTDKS